MKGFAIQLIDSSEQGNLMDIKIDPQIEDGKIIQGLVLGSTQKQNEALILMCNPGEIKSSPTLGVGLSSATLDDSRDMLSYRHSIRRNYALDGLKITKLDLYDIGNINIESKYE